MSVKKTFHIERSNQKRIITGILLAITCASICILHGAAPKGVVFGLCFVGISVTSPEINSRFAVYINTVWCAFSGVVAVILTQLLLNVGLASISPAKLLLGILAAEFVVSLIFLLTMNYRATVILSTGISLALATVNHFVFWFRGSEFAPYDILAASTALNVAEKYTFTLPPPMLYAYILGTLYCFCGFALPNAPVKRSLRNSLAAAVAW